MKFISVIFPLPCKFSKRICDCMQSWICIQRELSLLKIVTVALTSHVSCLSLSPISVLDVLPCCLVQYRSGLLGSTAKLKDVDKDTNLDSIHFPSCHLQVIFDAVCTVLTCAVKEVLCFQQSPSLLWQVDVVHVWDCQLLSLWDLNQRTQLNPEEEKHS